MTLSTSEIELLRSVMSRLNTSAGASSSFTHSGNFVRSSNSQLVTAFMSHSIITWIIDSSSFDHILINQSFLILY